MEHLKFQFKFNLKTCNVEVRIHSYRKDKILAVDKKKQMPELCSKLYFTDLSTTWRGTNSWPWRSSPV